MAQENEWLKTWGSPKSSNDGKKHLGDYLDEAGGYWSSPNTPTSKTRFGCESSFETAQNSHEKLPLMTKVHEKAKKWRLILPYMKKHLHGQANRNEQKNEIDRSKSMSSSLSLEDGGGTEDQDAEYLGAPMYESENSPTFYKQESTQFGSIMNSSPRLTRSPSRLTRCKSYRPRPGVESGIEGFQIHDMARTKSDPVRLKAVRLLPSEHQPTSFSFPTSPEIEEQLDDGEQTKPDNCKLDLTEYPLSMFSPRLGRNTPKKPQSSETRLLSNESNSRTICRDDGNKMTFTEYSVMVDEINELLESPTETSEVTTDWTEIQSAQEHHGLSPKKYQPVFFSGPSELNRHSTHETSHESHTDKVLSQVADKIADSQVATDQEPQLDVTNDHLTFNFAPIETETEPQISITKIQVPTDTPDCSTIEDSSTATFDNSKVETLDLNKPENPTPTAEPNPNNLELELLDLNKPENLKPVATHVSDEGMNSNTSSPSEDDDKSALEAAYEIVPQACNIVPERTNPMVEDLTQVTMEPQPQKLDSTSLELSKPINLKPISTKITVDHLEASNSNPTNQDDYKTVAEAVTEILTPAYHAVSEAASKIVESAQIGTKKKIAKNVPEGNPESKTGASDGGDYKTVTEAVGEMLTPVYSAVSHATNKVAGTGYQRGKSFRDYLKSKAVVGNAISRGYSLVGNEQVPGSPIPVSRNSYTEEKEEADGNGRRLQESTN